MNSSIMKLPGTKKQFPLVKPVVDSRRVDKPDQLPSGMTEPTIKKHTAKIISVYPARHTITPTTPKGGFGYRGFGSTSITPVIPKDKVTRPLLKNPDKGQPRPQWNSSPKVQEEKPIIAKPGTKSTDMDNVKQNPFKARPIPRSHYDKPFRPVLPSKKEKEGKNIVSDIASRMWHAVVDPLFPPKKPDEERPEDEEGTGEKPEEKEPEGQHGTRDSPSEPEADNISPVEDEGEPTAQPGLASRVWNSVVGPIFHPEQPDDEKVTRASEDKIEQEQTAEKPEVLEDSAEETVHPVSE